MTTTTAIDAGTILALDLGKYKTVACAYRSADDLRFTTVSTSRAELARLIDRWRPAVVLFEACLLAAGSAISASPRGWPAWSPTPAARPGSSSTSSARLIATTPCAWPKSRDPSSAAEKSGAIVSVRGARY
jgi:hypothetical protein